MNARWLWEEFPLELGERKQKILFPEGLAWSGEALRTSVTCVFSRELEQPEIELEEVVAQAVPSWNQVQIWLTELNQLRQELPTHPASA